MRQLSTKHNRKLQQTTGLLQELLNKTEQSPKAKKPRKAKKSPKATKIHKRIAAIISQIQEDIGKDEIFTENDGSFNLDAEVSQLHTQATILFKKIQDQPLKKQDLNPLQNALSRIITAKSGLKADRNKTDNTYNIPLTVTGNIRELAAKINADNFSGVPRVDITVSASERITMEVNRTRLYPPPREGGAETLTSRSTKTVLVRDRAVLQAPLGALKSTPTQLTRSRLQELDIDCSDDDTMCFTTDPSSQPDEFHKLYIQMAKTAESSKPTTEKPAKLAHAKEILEAFRKHFSLNGTPDDVQLMHCHETDEPALVIQCRFRSKQVMTLRRIETSAEILKEICKYIIDQRTPNTAIMLLLTYLQKKDMPHTVCTTEDGETFVVNITATGLHKAHSLDIAALRFALDSQYLAIVCEPSTKEPTKPRSLPSRAERLAAWSAVLPDRHTSTHQVPHLMWERYEEINIFIRPPEEFLDALKQLRITPESPLAEKLRIFKNKCPIFYCANSMTYLFAKKDFQLRIMDITKDIEKSARNHIEKCAGLLDPPQYVLPEKEQYLTWCAAKIAELEKLAGDDESKYQHGFINVGNTNHASIDVLEYFITLVRDCAPTETKNIRKITSAIFDTKGDFRSSSIMYRWATVLPAKGKLELIKEGNFAEAPSAAAALSSEAPAERPCAAEQAAAAAPPSQAVAPPPPAAEQTTQRITAEAFVAQIMKKMKKAHTQTASKSATTAARPGAHT